MIVELSKNEFSNILPLINKLENPVPLIFSVIEEKQNGRIFVDSRSKPSVALIYHEVGILNLIGNDKNEDFNKSLYKLIFEDIEHKQKYFALGVHSQTFEEKIEKLLGKSVDKDIRTCFSLSNSNLHENLNRAEDVMRKLQLKSIDCELMKKIDNEMNFCKGYWRTVDDFIKHGLGYCLLQDEKLASVCYSCTVGNNQMELDLETLKEFEGKGLATIITSIFINNCIKIGVEPLWVCDKNNAVSYNLAKKLGFEDIGSYSQYWWFLNKAENNL